MGKGLGRISRKTHKTLLSSHQENDKMKRKTEWNRKPERQNVTISQDEKERTDFEKKTKRNQKCEHFDGGYEISESGVEVKVRAEHSKRYSSLLDLCPSCTGHFQLLLLPKNKSNLEID